MISVTLIKPTDSKKHLIESDSLIPMGKDHSSANAKSVSKVYLLRLAHNPRR